MLALNLDQLKVSKNTKAHIWNRHRLHKKTSYGSIEPRHIGCNRRG